MKQHAEHPHHGSVTHAEHHQFERHAEDLANRQERDNKRLETKIDRLDAKIDAVLQAIRKR